MKFEEWEKEQRELAERVILRDDGVLKRFCGVAFSSSEDEIICASVVLEDEEIIEEKVVRGKADIPYIPSFRFYREGGLAMKLISSLESHPDVFIFQASGIAHPRFLGMASHLGVLMNLRTVGVTKKYLLGDLPRVKEGEWKILKHEGREVAVITKFDEKFSPLIISPGHRVSIMGAFEIIKNLMRGNSLPRPLREARRVAKKERLNTASQK
jgi:deoxyribonuclease V